MEVKRQKNQVQTKLTIVEECKGETLKTSKWVETSMTSLRTENPAGKNIEIVSIKLMEEIVERKSMLEALKRVTQNKGSPGIDGMTVSELGTYIENNWEQIKQDLFQGSYEPKPVKRAYIDKPGKIGKRALGIPCVLDRLIQQMIAQVLQKYIDPTFSDYSYGFRPDRSAHQAIAKAQEYIKFGYSWVVDIDLEKFFDRVNHDKIMGLLAKRIRDKRVLKLIRAILNSGVMKGGLVSPTIEGTPQGGPLSPLLSNVMLDLLDKELEKRGHKFVRYADDCNIYVKSERAGKRVLASINKYIQKKLKLRVNQDKTAVDKVHRRKFLGFSFMAGNEPKKRIAPESIERFKTKVRKITRRKRGKNVRTIIFELSAYLRGWAGYFGYCETPSVLKKLDGWIRRRLRSYVWKQWKTRKKRRKGLRKLGLKDRDLKIASSGYGSWRISKTKQIQKAMPNRFFDRFGLYRLFSS
jgi:RNA-directed DNA polymerase